MFIQSCLQEYFTAILQLPTDESPHLSRAATSVPQNPPVSVNVADASTQEGPNLALVNRLLQACMLA